jgi:hypothetical protein
MRYWHPLGANATATYFLPHPEYKGQQSGKDDWCCIFANEGIVQIFAHITDLFPTSKGKNTINQRYNTVSKLIDIANCKCTKTY